MMNRRTVKNSDEMVPKVQYDLLLEKYEKAVKNASSRASNMIPQGEFSSIEEKININNGNSIAESVDIVIDDERRQRKKIVNSFNPPMVSSKIKKESPSLSKLLEGQLMLQKGNVDSAQNVFKTLMQNNEMSIRVSASYFFGKIIFEQKEYSLAMQVFEDIVHQYGFSSYVILALDHLIECAEKLNIQDKYERYYSMRHDLLGV